jgi:two-component sensor histidine kinase
MNTITSLLAIQASTISEPLAIRALGDAGNRVRSMSLLYDKLYRSTDFKGVSIKEYLSLLTDEIIANFPNSHLVTVKKDIEDFILDAKRLQSIGVIVNELITNSMKYAFKGKVEGTIMVSASNTKGIIILSLQDDGIGMPDDVSPENPSGFGLQLVNGLARQLGGTVKFERGNGTRFVLEFRQ